jgi:hypothetical protein
MVTVPAMGAEWSKDELKNMTKAGRKEKKAESRKVFWTAWRRDQRGLCGKWFTRRVLVFFMFAVCIACVYSLLANSYMLTLLQHRNCSRHHNSPGTQILVPKFDASRECDRGLGSSDPVPIFSFSSKFLIPCVRRASTGHHLQFPTPPLHKHESRSV